MAGGAMIGSTSDYKGVWTKIMDNITESEDEQVAGWLLMDNFSSVFIISVVYVIFCKFVGHRLMEGREPFSLKRIILIYNIYQILACTAISYQIVSQGVWVLLKLECDVKQFYNPKIPNIAYWGLWLKITELIETVFFILRKKQSQVSNLHLYHHSTTFLYLWLGLKYGGGLGMSTCLLYNSVVHILMYIYYTLAAVGSEDVQKRIQPFKKYITITQMVQFTIMLAAAIRYALAGCELPRVLTIVFLPNVVFVYYMFYNFYQSVYKIEKTE